MSARRADVLTKPRDLAWCDLCGRPVVIVPDAMPGLSTWVYNPTGTLHLCRSIDRLKRSPRDGAGEVPRG